MTRFAPRLLPWPNHVMAKGGQLHPVYHAMSQFVELLCRWPLLLPNFLRTALRQSSRSQLCVASILKLFDLSLQSGLATGVEHDRHDWSSSGAAIPVCSQSLLTTG